MRANGADAPAGNRDVADEGCVRSGINGAAADDQIDILRRRGRAEERRGE